jgi:hypothetical protein
MLKITHYSNETSTTLRLEGRVAGPWLAELARSWQRVLESEPNSKVVDLTGVTFIEPQGRRMLSRMWREGAEFVATGCLTKCIVEEITRSGRAGSSKPSRMRTR